MNCLFDLTLHTRFASFKPRVIDIQSWTRWHAWRSTCDANVERPQSFFGPLGDSPHLTTASSVSVLACRSLLFQAQAPSGRRPFWFLSEGVIDPLPSRFKLKADHFSVGCFWFHVHSLSGNWHGSRSCRSLAGIEALHRSRILWWPAGTFSVDLIPEGSSSVPDCGNHCYIQWHTSTL